MFLRRCGSTILACTIIRSIIAKILKITRSCRVRQVTVLKTITRSFFLFLEVIFSANSSVTLCHRQLMQLQWNMSTSVFSMLSSMLVTYLTQTRFLCEQYYTTYSLFRVLSCSFRPQDSFFSFYSRSSSSSIVASSRLASLSIMVSRVCPENFFKAVYFTYTRTAYLRLQTVCPSTYPIVYSLPLLDCPELQVSDSSEAIILCLRRNLNDYSIVISTRFTFSLKSRFCWAATLSFYSIRINSRKTAGHWGKRRSEAKRLLLKHLSRTLQSLKAQLSQRQRMKALGEILLTCARTQFQMMKTRPSIWRTQKLSGELRALQRGPLSTFFIFRMKSHMKSPKLCWDLVSQTNLKRAVTPCCYSGRMRSNYFPRMYSIQTSCRGISSPFLGGLPKSSLISHKFIFLSWQAQSRQQVWMMRQKKERRSRGNLPLSGLCLARKLKRTSCVSGYVFYSTFRYSQLISRTFSWSVLSYLWYCFYIITPGTTSLKLTLNSNLVRITACAVCMEQRGCQSQGDSEFAKWVKMDQKKKNHYFSQLNSFYCSKVIEQSTNATKQAQLKPAKPAQSMSRLAAQWQAIGQVCSLSR